MVQLFLAVLGALRVFFRSRSDTALEILALRQQVAVLKRQRPRPPLNSGDRFCWTTLRRFWSRWTDVSTTDPDALLARKGTGKEAKLSYNGNLLTENRQGLIVNTEVFQANGTAERYAALVMLEQIPGGHRVTVGGDKCYDTQDFVRECHNLRATPHVAQNTNRKGGSTIDGRPRAIADTRSVRESGNESRSASDG